MNFFTDRFWQPNLPHPSASWSVDNVFIGGSEISAEKIVDKFEGDYTVSFVLLNYI